MIASNMKPCIVEQRQQGVDAYAQPLKSFSYWKTVEIGIYLQTQSVNENDVRFREATHLGLTFDKTIESGMQIAAEGKTYHVLLVNNGGRMAQLTLKEV